MKSKVIVRCWSCSHETELFLNKQQQKKLDANIQIGQAVCPNCRNAGKGNLPIFVREGLCLIYSPKILVCDGGHTSTISCLTNDVLHLRFGHGSEDFVNIDGTSDELQFLINENEIVCHHVGCGKKLSPVDDAALEVSSVCSIKTKTRVGDLWDKNHIEPVRQGTYDLKRGEYDETRSERANKERLKKIRKRNISEEHSPGRRIDKPTDRDYGYKFKDQVNF